MKLSCKISIVGCLLALWSVGSWAAIPPGYYYMADGKQKAQLKTALSNIVSQARMLSYGSGDGATWTGFYTTDRRADNSVIDMYSSVDRYFVSPQTAIDGMHIEHSFPKSWWGSYVNNAYKDLFHLYPADGTTNSTKSNLPLGEVSSATFDNGVSRIGTNGFGSYVGNCFEPDDEYKGDFARSYLYVVTAYESFASMWISPMLNNNTYPVWKPWAKDLLLTWHRQDPVSQKEIDRNEAVYAIQGNRNPYIDYPDLAEYIWGADTLSTYHFPAETVPFLATPNRWSRVDFGVKMQGTSSSTTLQIVGKLLTLPLSLALKNGSSQLALSGTSVSVAAASNGYTLTISLNATGFGAVNDTLVIGGGGLAASLLVPIQAIVSRDFMTLPATDITSVSAQLNWMSHPSATNYNIELFSNCAQSGDLFFSGYLEGASWDKGLVIYNGTGQTIDLSHYSLRKQNNGVGSFSGNYALSGSLASGQTYVIMHHSANATLLALANHVVAAADNQSSIVSFNGNDAVGLYHEGVMIDLVGERDNPDIWGEDLILQRKADISFPSEQFSWNEWNVLPYTQTSALTPHTVNVGTLVPYEQRTATTNSYTLGNLMPSTTYFVKVAAQTTPTATSTVNTVRFTTLSLSAPEILEPSFIEATQFTANWEETPGMTDYQLDVFQKVPNGTKTVAEGFDNLGSNGKPLPAGWEGSASGNYTTAASSGLSAPSVALKNEGEYIAVTYETAASSLGFMYRFPSGGTTSYMTVEAFNDTVWSVVDTLRASGNAKHTAGYTFSVGDNFRRFRLTYAHKAAGYLAIDDVTAEIVHMDTTFVLAQQPTTGNQYQVTGLTLQQTYFYRVRSSYYGAYSPWSDVARVTTEITVPIDVALVPDPATMHIFADNAGLHISGSKQGDVMQLYTVSGVCLLRQTLLSSNTFIPLSQRGLFIVKITSPDGRINSTKIAK